MEFTQQTNSTRCNCLGKLSSFQPVHSTSLHMAMLFKASATCTNAGQQEQSYSRVNLPVTVITSRQGRKRMPLAVHSPITLRRSICTLSIRYARPTRGSETTRTSHASSRVTEFGCYCCQVEYRVKFIAGFCQWLIMSSIMYSGSYGSVQQAKYICLLLLFVT